MAETGHNWNHGPLGPACVRCGCQMFSIFHEPTERGQKPCLGRKPTTASLPKAE
jgi:hypothetical protein